MVNVLIKRNVWLAGASRKSGSQISTFSQRSFPYSANTPYPLFIEAKHSLNQVDYPIGFVSVSGSANGHFVIAGQTLPNLTIHFESSPDLVTAFGNGVAVTANGTGAFQYDDAGATSLTMRFYRATYP